MSARLDQGLISKIATKTDKTDQYVREQISKKASRLGIVSSAAQILWAKELGISTTRSLQKLEPHVQEQVRSELPRVFAAAPSAPTNRGRDSRPRRAREADPARLAAEYLLTDPELRDRCADLLRARRNFDRAVREGTTVFDARLREHSGVKEKINPVPLINKVLNPDPKKAIMVVSENADEQEGFYSLCKGLMLAFRNPAHHGLDDKLTRLDALRICGMIDVLLPVLARATIKASES